MNIEKIKYFIDLVECNSFTETAKKNYVSQTTISQQIASLEKEFNTQLINRKITPIVPTTAGYLFYEEANILWKQYQTMLVKMKNHTYAHKQTLRIAYSSLTDINSLITILPLYQKQFSNTAIILDKVPLKNVADLLVRGIYDLAIAFDSEFYMNKDITTISIYQGTYSAAVGKNHSLYNEKIITAKKLYDYPLVMMSSEAIGKSYDLMIQHSHMDGYEPNIVKTVNDIETEYLIIQLENLIGFLPDNYSINDTIEDIRLIPLQGTHHQFKIVAAFLKANPNKMIQSFINLLN